MDVVVRNRIAESHYNRYGGWAEAHPVGIIKINPTENRLVYVPSDYDRYILEVFKYPYDQGLGGEELFTNPVLRLAIWFHCGARFQTETRPDEGDAWPVLNSNKDFSYDGGEDNYDDPVFMENDTPTDIELLLAYECLVGLEHGRIMALRTLFKAYKGFNVKGFKDEWISTPIPLSVFNWEAHPEGIYALTAIWTGDEAEERNEE